MKRNRKESEAALEWGKILGAKLRTYRQRSKIKCRELGDLLGGYTAGHISNMEAARSAPNAYHMQKFAEIFEVEVVDLFPTKVEIDHGIPAVLRIDECVREGLTYKNAVTTVSSTMG